MPAAPVLHKLGRFPLVNTSVFVFQLGRTLLDAGPANQWHRLRPLLEGGRVEQVVVSHHHEDHSGCASLIQELGIPVLAPPSALPFLRDGFRMEFPRQLIFGVPGRLEALPLPAEGVRVEGFGTVRAVPAPGHSSDHHALLAQDCGWLFAADLFVTPRPALYRRSDQCARLEIESLRAVLAEDFDTVFCSHRGRLEGDGRAPLRTRLDWLAELQGRAQRLREEEGLPMPELTRRVLGPASPFNRAMEWATRGSFSAENLLHSLLDECEHCAAPVPSASPVPKSPVPRPPRT